MCGCSDCEGTDVTLGPAGLNGWSPEYAVVVDPGDSTREVLRLMNWWGGTGNRPSFSGTIMTDAWLSANAVYLGSTGWTANIASATNVRGTDGADALITVVETDGTPTGTPTIMKFGPGTLAYSTTTNANDTVTYDPEGDWINIGYTGGAIDNSNTDPWYESQIAVGPGNEGVLIGEQSFKPYIGAGSDYTTGDPPIRRLKYKINDDKTITLEGHIECEFTTNDTTLNLYSGSDINSTGNTFTTPRALLKFNFPTAIADIGTTVHQYPCIIIVSVGALETTLASRTSLGVYQGSIHFTKDYIQIECMHPNNITVANATSHTVNVIISSTFVKRSGV
jgi:hypothetical protein